MNPSSKRVAPPERVHARGWPWFDPWGARPHARQRGLGCTDAPGLPEGSRGALRGARSLAYQQGVVTTPDDGGGCDLSAAVVVVRSLDRSLAFYRELLDLDVGAASGEAALLSSRRGDRLVLRELGAAPHVSAAIGVLFLVWTAQTAAELDRAEAVLRAREAFASRSVDEGWDVLEGHDPDHIRVVVACPIATSSTRTSLPARVYNY